MPGITFSSLFISTDVPLMFFSALTAFCITKIYTTNKRNYVYYILLAFAIALGILSKYATFYIFVILKIWL